MEYVTIDKGDDWSKLMAYKPNPFLKFVWSAERTLRFFHPRRLFNKLIKYPYQRLSRGFSDQDAWNANTHLARQIAGMLRWYIKNSNGVSYPYYTYDEDVNKAALLRDIEFENYAVMFDEFAENGVAHNKKWQERCGGLSQQEYKKMMKWFTENFPGLWD